MKNIAIEKIEEQNTYKRLFESENFRNAILKDKLCIFLGSGVARNLEMPDWQGLSNEIIELGCKNKIISHTTKEILKKDNDLIKVISYCINRFKEAGKGKEKKLNNLLNKLFHTNPRRKVSKNQIYKNLINMLKEDNIILVQTNYDTILEFFTGRDSFITYSEDFGVIKSKKLSDYIFYLHGKCTKADSVGKIILSREDYNKAYILDKHNNQENLWKINQNNFLRIILSNYYVLFLGYSLNDIEVLQAVSKIEKMNELLETVILINTFCGNDIEKQIFDDYMQNYKIKVETYNIDRLSISDNFQEVITELKKAVEQIRPIKESYILNQGALNFEGVEWDG